MAKLNDLKEAVKQKQKKEKEVKELNIRLEKAYSRKFHSVTPMVTSLLNNLGNMLAGKFLFIFARYEIKKYGPPSYDSWHNWELKWHKKAFDGEYTKEIIRVDLYEGTPPSAGNYYFSAAFESENRHAIHTRDTSEEELIRALKECLSAPYYDNYD